MVYNHKVHFVLLLYSLSVNIDLPINEGTTVWHTLECASYVSMLKDLLHHLHFPASAILDKCSSKNKQAISSYPKWINSNGLWYRKAFCISCSLRLLSYRFETYCTQEKFGLRIREENDPLSLWMEIISADAHRGMRYRKELSVMVAIPSIRSLDYRKIFSRCNFHDFMKGLTK